MEKTKTRRATESPKATKVEEPVVEKKVKAEKQSVNKEVRGKKSDIKKEVKIKNYIPRLRQEYNTKISNDLTSQFGIKNKMQIPKLCKISLNMGLGDAKDNKNNMNNSNENIQNDDL